MTPAAAMPVAIEVLGFDIGPIPIVLGVLTGLTYGLLAVGLVLVYRASKFINFAQTAVGVFGAAVLGALVTRAGVPYWIAFPVGIIAGAGMAGLIEAGLIRRISSYPRVIGMVVTLGMATFLLAISTVINADAVTGIKYPKPPGLPTFEVGGLPISSAYVAMVMLTPLVLVALVWFLKRSRYGLATRAAADNADAASLAGVSAARMVTLSWVVAGAISAFTAILVWPTQGTQGTDGLGPTLLLKGLAGAVIARFQSLPLALGSSVIIGVIEQILLTGSVTGGLVELALGVIIILALLLQPRLGRRQESEGDWGRLFPAPLPSVYQRVLLVRIMDRTVIAMLLVGLAALYLVINNAVASGLVYVVGFTLVGLSVAIVTGLAGQLTLGQFAFAGIGAAVSVQVGNATGNYWLGLVAGVAAAAVAAALVGVPALRLRGLALAVSTLAFALITSAWLLKQPFFLGEGVSPSRPVIFGFSFAGAKEYYLLAVLFLALGIVVAGNVRSSGFGRLLRALRDNEEAARALTVGASRRKLQVYAVAGAIAGLGGIVLGQAQVTLTTLTFSPQASIDVVATAVVGGLGVLLGPLYGSAYAVGIPTLLKFDALLISVLTLSWLVILVIVPGGLGSGVAAVRRRVADTLARASGIDPVQARLDDAGGGAADRSVSVATSPRAAVTEPPSARARCGRARDARADQVLRRRAGRAGSTCRCRRARSSGSSAPTAPARPPSRDGRGLHQARRGCGALPGQGHHPPLARAARRAGPRALVPGRPALPHPHGARHGDRGAGVARPVQRRARLGGSQGRRPAQARPRHGAARRHGPGSARAPARGAAVHRHPAHGRADLAAGAGPRRAPARRARRRHRAERGRRARGAVRHGAPRARDDVGRHRARPAAAVPPGRPARGHGARRGHRRGHP
jgi:ABC-type branched-subunit amino acid transport system permease subunit